MRFKAMKTQQKEYWEKANDVEKRNVMEYEDKDQKKLCLLKPISTSHTDNAAVGPARQACRSP